MQNSRRERREAETAKATAKCAATRQDDCVSKSAAPTKASNSNCNFESSTSYSNTTTTWTSECLQLPLSSLSAPSSLRAASSSSSFSSALPRSFVGHVFQGSSSRPSEGSCHCPESRRPESRPSTLTNAKRKTGASGTEKRRRKSPLKRGAASRVRSWSDIFPSEDEDGSSQSASTLSADPSVRPVSTEQASVFSADWLVRPPRVADPSKPPQLQDAAERRLCGVGNEDFSFRQPEPWVLRWFPAASVGSGESAQRFSRRMRQITASANSFLKDSELPPAPLLRSCRRVFSDTQVRFLNQLRVAIVGGGLAGLSAADRLGRCGVAVDLYEGRGRLGGRACSLNVGGLEGVDLGASWIHGYNRNPVAKICRNFGLAVHGDEDELAGLSVPLHGEDGRLVPPSVDCWADGVQRRFHRESLSFVKEALQRKCSHPECRSKRPSSDGTASSSSASKTNICRHATHILLQTSVGDFMDPFNKSELDAAEQRDREAHPEMGSRDLSQSRALRQSLLDWYRSNIEYCTGADVHELCLATWDQDDATALGGRHVLIRRGFKSVAECLLPLQEDANRGRRSLGPPPRVRLGEDLKNVRIRLNAAVKKVQRFGHGVTLTLLTGEETPVYDFCILTVPLGVLKASLRNSKTSPSPSASSAPSSAPSTSPLAISSPEKLTVDNVAERLLSAARALGISRASLKAGRRVSSSYFSICEGPRFSPSSSPSSASPPSQATLQTAADLCILHFASAVNGASLAANASSAVEAVSRHLALKEKEAPSSEGDEEPAVLDTFHELPLLAVPRPSFFSDALLVPLRDPVTSSGESRSWPSVSVEARVNADSVASKFLASGESPQEALASGLRDERRVLLADSEASFQTLAKKAESLANAAVLLTSQAARELACFVSEVPRLCSSPSMNFEETKHLTRVRRGVLAAAASAQAVADAVTKDWRLKFSEASKLKTNDLEGGRRASLATAAVKAGRSFGCIEFSPPLPSWKVSAINRVGMGCLNKVVFVFDRVFWPTEQKTTSTGAFRGDKEERRSFGFRQRCWISSTRGEFAQVVYQHPKPVIFMLLPGHFGVKSEEMRKNILVDRGMEVLNRLHPGNVGKPIVAFVSRWKSDPLARGAYSFLPPGSTGKNFDFLSFPVEDRLLFAGEHTCRAYPSTTHGALLSGRREAERILSWASGKMERRLFYKWDSEKQKPNPNAVPVEECAVFDEDSLSGPNEDEIDAWFREAPCGLCGERQDLRRPFLGCIDIPHSVLLEEGLANPEFLSTRSLTRSPEALSPSTRFAFHEDCSCACPEVRTSCDGTRWFNLRKAFLRVSRVRCVICHQVGASVKCEFGGCSSFAHFACASSEIGVFGCSSHSLDSPPRSSLKRQAERCLQRKLNDEAERTNGERLRRQVRESNKRVRSSPQWQEVAVSLIFSEDSALDSAEESAPP